MPHGSASPQCRNERTARRVLQTATVVSAIAVCAIFGFLAWFSLPLFSGQGWAEVMSWTWRPFQGAFGILPMALGSLLLSLPALALAYPLGLGVCCFAHGLGPARPSKVVMGVVHFMTSIPTVVYGFVAVFLMVPLIRSAFASGTGFSWLAAVLGLSVLTVPTVTLMIHSQFLYAEPRVRLTAAALGLSQSQKLARLVLPLSSRGLLAAAVLGFGRAVGDTMIPLMLAGNAAQVPTSPLEPFRVLTSHIALVVAVDSQSAAYQSLFACGLILFGVTVAVNLALRWIGRGSAPEALHG